MLGNGGNGQDISMTGEKRTLGLTHLRSVEAYWHGLCDGDKVPLRSQIDPRGMEDALEYAFLMERVAPTMAKIRVAGSHLTELMGMQISGMPLSSLIAPSDRERFGKAVAKLFGEQQIVKINLRADSGFGKPALTGHMLLLPLRSDFGDLSRALGVLATDGRIGRTPRRFTVDRIESKPAIDTTFLTPTRPISVPRDTLREDLSEPLAGLQEPSSPFRGALSSKQKVIKSIPAKSGVESGSGKVPHLRLVVSNT